jgi:hypothetical protein
MSPVEYRFREQPQGTDQENVNPDVITFNRALQPGVARPTLILHFKDDASTAFRSYVGVCS